MTSSPGPREQLHAFTRLLQESGVDSPRLSAEVLLAHALGLDRGELLKRLILAPDAPLTEEERLRAEELVARRAKGEPVAYIVGVKEFYGRDFTVSRATLVPRPETELLADLALEEARRRPADQGGLFADFGTGTGCIAVTLALALPRWRGLALDISADALLTARANARRHNARNLGLLRADFTLPPLAPARLDLLVSNPPYVSEEEYAALDREVRDFEPKSALVPSPAGPGGFADCFCQPVGQNAWAVHPKRLGCGFFSPGKATGLEHAVSVLDSAARLLKPGGLLLMEIGHAQGRPLLAALDPNAWSEGAVHKDLAGLDRVLAARKRADKS